MEQSFIIQTERFHGDSEYVYVNKQYFENQLAGDHRKELELMDIRFNANFCLLMFRK